MLDELRQLLQTSETSPKKESSPGHGRAVSVTVGLDFGTCASKCVVNFEGHDQGRDLFMALAFPSRSSPDGVLCVPTSIGVSGGNLLFGEEGDGLPEASVIRSFKMAIPCMGKGWGDYRSAFTCREAPGCFDIEGRRFSAADLAALYLAVMLRQIKRQTSQYVHQDVSVFLNVAAPLNELVRAEAAEGRSNLGESAEEQARDTAVSREYVVLGQRALMLSEIAQNPWPVEQAFAAIGQVKTRPIASLADSPAYVVPETLAAIAGFANRPGTQAGRFMTLDVGAGSTDASVFWLEKANDTITLWYYTSRSLHVGMDAIDRALAEVTRHLEGRSLRERRETLQQEKDNLAEYRSYWEAPLEEIDKHRKKTFGRGYAKEKGQSLWGNGDRAHVALLLIGGGCQFDPIRQLSHQELWINMIGAPAVETLGLDATRHVLGPDGLARPLDGESSLAEQSHLLLIAEGLANKIVDIPPFGISNELIRPRKRRPIPPDQWWVRGKDETWQSSV